MELISGCPRGGKGKREEQKLIGHFQAPFFRLFSKGALAIFFFSLGPLSSSSLPAMTSQGKREEDEVCVGGTARKRDSYTSLLLAVERGIEEKSGWDRRKSVGAENEGIFFSIPLPPSSYLTDGGGKRLSVCPVRLHPLSHFCGPPTFRYLECKRGEGGKEK